MLEKLLWRAAVDGLKLMSIHGVNGSEEVERMMIEREFLAGVVFYHSAVINRLHFCNFDKDIVKHTKRIHSIDGNLNIHRILLSSRKI